MRVFAALFVLILGCGLLLWSGACGGGNGEEPPETPCGMVLGENLIVPLALDVEAPQVLIDVQFITVSQSRIDSLRAGPGGWPFPTANYAQVSAGAPGADAGSACGSSVATGAEVVGGAIGSVLVVPQLTAGNLGLPNVVPSPLVLNQGGFVFPNMGGPGEFSILALRQRGLSDILSLPAVPTLPDFAGNTNVEVNYLLTDAAGLAQFISELQASPTYGCVDPASVVTLQNQTATFFAGTEVAASSDLTEPHRTAADAINASELKDVGLALSITPTITSQGFVLLELEPEVSMAIAEAPGTQLLDGVTPSRVRIPVVQRGGTHASIVTFDGTPVILGGQRESATDVDGVPLLSKLPLIGAFLRQHNQLDLRDVLYVTITPRIVKDPE